VNILTEYCVLNVETHLRFLGARRSIRGFENTKDDEFGSCISLLIIMLFMNIFVSFSFRFTKPFQHQYDQSLMGVEQISRKRCSGNAVGIEKINENSHGTKRLRPPDKLPTENSEAVEENSSSVFGLVMLFNGNKNVLILSIVQESLIITREL
jgi:hypothetical protein